MRITTASSISELKSFCKDHLTDNSPFMDYNFFYSLEKSLCTSKNTGWIPEHLLIKKNNVLIGFIPNFKKLNSNGEYVFDQIWENAHYQIGLEYFPKFLSASPFTPVNREKFIYKKEKFSDHDFFLNLISFLKKENISSFHINFIDKKVSNFLEKNGFIQRVGIQYHWKNKNYKSFDDFLANLRSRKKKNILKERKFLVNQKIKFKIKYGNEIIKKDIKLFFECYKNTIRKKYSYQYLNLNFFYNLFDSDLRKKIILIIASDNRDHFIGCSLHFIGNKTLYGRYWGCLKKIPYLHFELCYYQAIEFAIKKKIEKIESGAQGEHKISRGYYPTTIYSNHWIKNELLNEGIKKFLNIEKKKVNETIRYLEKFVPFNN